MLAGVAPAPESVESQPDVANSNYQVEGVVNASVFVRSGPQDSYYSTMKLEKGAKVTVVGERFGWLKIVPPEGSFCYVAKVYVEKTGDGTVGRVNAKDINVRAGSSLNTMKTTVLGKLSEGDQVQILGEQEEYFKIKPPADCYLYISEQFVDQVKVLGAAGSTGGAGTAAVAAGTAVTGSSVAGGAGSFAAATTIPSGIAGATTIPSDVTASASSTTQPLAAATTQPDATAIDLTRFDALEADYSAESVKPLDQQPIDEMLKGYNGLLSDNLLPDSLMQIAQLRSRVLAIRADSKAKLLAAREAQQQAEKQRMVLVAENQELSQRIKDTTITTYSAVGTLQASSLQTGGATLYRLTDPANGRTVIYIRSSDPAIVQYVGQFIGVRGPVSTDPQIGLRQIIPTAAEPVDVAKVNVTVIADIAPPSLAPGAPQANAGN
jgi:uncharacterized protein YgiM (DUF1202 family)